MMWSWEQYFFVQDECKFVQRNPRHKGSVQIVAQAKQSQNHKINLPILVKEFLMDMVKFYLTVVKQAEHSPKKSWNFLKFIPDCTAKKPDLGWNQSANLIIRATHRFSPKYPIQNFLAHHGKACTWVTKNFDFFQNLWRFSSQKKPDLAWNQRAELL